MIKSKYFKKHILDTPLPVSILVTRYEEEVNTPIYASFSAFNISEEKNEFTSMYQSLLYHTHVAINAKKNLVLEENTHHLQPQSQNDLFIME